MTIKNITGAHIKITCLGISISPNQVINLDDNFSTEQQKQKEIKRAIDKGWFKVVSSLVPTKKQEFTASSTFTPLTQNEKNLRRAVFTST